MGGMRYQPQGPARLGGNRALQRGLLAYTLLSSRHPRDLADGSQWTVVASSTPLTFDIARRGIGVSFKGATPAYVTRPTPAVAVAPAALTIRFRFYLRAAQGTSALMTFGNVSYDGAPAFYCRYDGSALSIYFAGGYRIYQSVQVETEYILTHTYDGTTHRTYLNGVLINTVVAGWSGGAANLYLGTGFNGAVAGQNFILSDFALWNRALPPAEVGIDWQSPWEMIDDGGDEDDYPFAAAAFDPIALSGAASATTIAVGALSTSIRLVGAANATAAASGALSTATRLTGAALVSAGAAGGLSTSIRLAGAAAAQSDAAGALSTAVSLTGSALSRASASGALAGAGAALAGGAVVQSSASGALLTTIRLAGAADCGATVSGSLAGAAAAFAGAAVARSSVAGGLSTSILLAGSAVGRMSAAGALGSAQLPLAVADVSTISPARIVVFEGSGSRVVPFDSSGSRVTPFGGSGCRVVPFEGSGSRTVRFQ